MKNRNEHMDQIFQDRLNDYASPSPDHLWEKIDARRSNRKKPFFKRWHFNLLGLALLLSSLAIGWLVAGQHSKNVIDVFQLAQSQNETAEINSMAIVAKPENENTAASAEGITSENTVQAINEEAKAGFPTQSVSEKRKTPSSNTDLVESSISTAESKIVPANVGQVIAEASTSESLSNRAESNHSTENKIALTNELPSVDEPLFQDLESNSARVVLTKNESESPVQQETQSTATLPSSLEVPTFNRLEALYLPKQNSLSEIVRQPDESLLEFKPRGCYSFKGSRMSYNLFVDVFYSLDKPIRSMSAKNSEYLDYLAAREATESSFHANSAGVRVSMVSQEGFALRSGLVYSQITEVFDYENENEVRIFVNVEYEIDPFSGDTLSEREVVTREEGIRRKTTYNKYRMLDIPLILGYEWYFKKFSLDINAGVYFNVLFKQKGDILSPDTYPDLAPVSISSDNPNAQPVFLDKLGLSVYGSLGLNYNLNQDVQLLFEPNFRYQVKSITLEDYILDQRYIIPGLLVGVRFRI